MISVSGLVKKFETVTAVNDVSFEVERGGVFGLIGPDGAGKTTTLRVISTAMQPTRGRVTVGGLEVIAHAEEVKTLVGYMPQRFALYPDLTVIENLNFFADLYGSPRAERAERLSRLLQFARLTEFQGRRAAQLSGGMQKKLALAATLMHRPRVLLLDEPTTGVDPVSRREFWDLLTEVHLEGVTIIISTPYLDEAERCTRVGLMYRGKLIACDTPAQLRENMPATVLEAQVDEGVRARKSAAHLPGVLNASTHGDLIRLLVDRPDRQEGLQSAWNSETLSYRNLRIVRPRLEDAFLLLVKER